MSVCLITGSSRGIGLALTRELLAEGHEVIGSIRGGPAPVRHDRFRTIVFDVRDEAALEEAARGISGPIDVLVNNAGISGPGDGISIPEIDIMRFSETLDVNVIGPLRVIRTFLPRLMQSDGAKVVAISSQLGSMAYPGSGHMAYRTSKAALNKMMQCVGAALLRMGIASVIAHPGWVRTDMGGSNASISPEESAKGLVRRIDELTLGNSCRFIDWDGREREW
jgi:NAD(P)-dependent dehydrogenase (short-subunit alcohol dehydrogenase family)